MFRLLLLVEFISLGPIVQKPGFFKKPGFFVGGYLRGLTPSTSPA